MVPGAKRRKEDFRAKPCAPSSPGSLLPFALKTPRPNGAAIWSVQQAASLRPWRLKSVMCNWGEKFCKKYLKILDK
jgi:hypothetical protein